MKQTLSIFSWNINGIRAGIRKGTFDTFLQIHDPDIICLQETKAHKGQVDIDFPQYTEYWYSAEKKGYSGVAIFSKTPALAIIEGIPSEILGKGDLVDDHGRDAGTEGRVIAAEYEKFFLVNVYTPNAKDSLERIPLRHKKWDPLFLHYCKTLEQKKPVLFVGDLNVAHHEIDLARPKENIGKKGFTREEREGIDNIIASGFIDTLRFKKGNMPNLYTWWSHWGGARERNVGWRIDYVFASHILKKNIVSADIHPEILGSDHCPVSVTVTL
ncbi:MAG: exodeoxyribonuclease III [Candidatus Magasanikbacteria bacterium CG10_big_fil_rev_8_21_14_0_10_43_6]|uniref:Exodeoxyribonuclease III n=1 Tax=Candidatus Magasanikbacteria bacterium CG10_big_fil_rev_8_21_14_0_10_43_6 TaxID=1974650 RepID=A0A2M6W0L1_9BACT|nr:MAG: exodeoxyribonuclease III [Candidatus Magasanikbacteria bacterium CG10_big_fil_rev_8_21_14_0_10_43_6]